MNIYLVFLYVILFICSAVTVISLVVIKKELINKGKDVSYQNLKISEIKEYYKLYRNNIKYKTIFVMFATSFIVSIMAAIVILIYWL